jgi:two-component system response regulator MprA
VLVVDDESVPREVISKYLLADGHDVATAASGAEAMVKLLEQKFDLLLTDQAMADMSGLQLAAALKRMGGDQPVILMTASNEVASQLEQSAGVDMVLRKPIPQKSLRHALRRVWPEPAASG